MRLSVRNPMQELEAREFKRALLWTLCACVVLALPLLWEKRDEYIYRAGVEPGSVSGGSSSRHNAEMTMMSGEGSWLFAIGYAPLLIANPLSAAAQHAGKPRRETG